MGKGTGRVRPKVRKITRRDFLLASAGAGLYLGLGNRGVDSAAGAQTAPPGNLEIFNAGWPRTFFFRQTEYEARDRAIYRQGQPPEPLTFESWAKRFSPLGGIMGKVLNEEHDFSAKQNKEWFRRYKELYPNKAVFLHYNGTGRRPTDEATTKFSPGHFLHYKGTRLTRPIGSSRAASYVLPVADTSVFKMNRSHGINDDIAIVPFVNGRPNWNGRVEQVRLKAINAATKTITVQRAAFGTAPVAFPAGSYLAPHVVVGPYAQAGIAGETVALWAYNLSTVGPRDGRGRNGIDALVEYLKAKFTGAGDLASFDGITIDILFFALRASAGNLVDANGDGQADGALINGVDVWGPGQLEFIEDLRAALPGKMIMSDGQFPVENQRSFGYLNGIEAEGYPDLWDNNLQKLSQGSNSFAYWGQSSPEPRMSYVNYKFKDQFGDKTPRNTFWEKGEAPGGPNAPNVDSDKSYKKLRLTLASALFTDTSFTNAGDWRTEGLWAPPETTLNADPSVKVQVFDEYWRGVDQVPNWLGQPLGPAQPLAEREPDLLGGKGSGEPGSWAQAFRGSFTGTGVAFDPIPDGTPGMRVRSTVNNSGVPVLRRSFSFSLRASEISIPAGEPDLYVTLRLEADALPRYKPYAARRVYVTATPDGTVPAVESFTWAGREPFTATFNFRGVGPGPVRLDFKVEGDTPVRLLRLTAHAGPDAVYREYENGAVFANASNAPFTFDVAGLLPGGSFRRILGQPNQANVPADQPADESRRVNDGTDVGATLEVPARDALLVVRKPAATP